MISIEYIVYSVLLAMFVHMSYVYVMCLRWARKKEYLRWPEHWPVFGFIVPTLVAMIPFYITLNLTLASVLFLDPPRSLQFTARCDRYLAGNLSWGPKWLKSFRFVQAKWWCKNFLDPFEEGGHCRYKE